MSVFSGNQGIGAAPRWMYKSVGFADIALTTAGDANKNTSKLVKSFKQSATFVHLINETDQDVIIHLVSPLADPATNSGYKVFVELCAGQAWEVGASKIPGFEIPAKTKIYVQKTIDPTSGSLKLWTWG